MDIKLKVCSGCSCTLSLDYFPLNRKGEHAKTCSNCKERRNKMATRMNTEIKVTPQEALDNLMIYCAQLEKKLENISSLLGLKYERINIQKVGHKWNYEKQEFVEDLSGWIG